MPRNHESTDGTVSAIVLSYNRAEALGVVLDRLSELPVDEVLVADNGSSDGTVEIARSRADEVTVIELGENVGIRARNVAAREAKGELLLMLDDDSYPLPGAVEQMVSILRQDSRVGAVGGLVREIMDDQRVLEGEVGTFDWFLRGGRSSEPPPLGFPAFFFPEGACIVRREAFLQAGGFFEPFFFGNVELDLATRLIGLGWDVRYLPSAPFNHMKQQGRSYGFGGVLRHRIRNHLWYLWLRFPAPLALRRIPAYLLFDLVECAYRRTPSAWVGGIADAWRQRQRVRHARRPLSRAVVRRAELNRGRLHLRLLGEMVVRRVRLPWRAAAMRRP